MRNITNLQFNTNNNNEKITLHVSALLSPVQWKFLFHIEIKILFTNSVVRCVSVFDTKQKTAVSHYVIDPSTVNY